ncbi:hypothetical protein [Aquamicrobium ahrensii]|uniref:DUF3828 domain-containing protein n=1 Tax=Aquamicrobium ahrensii TaxID=469551 RepID=A0ABV2KIT9_9HYPH
MRLSPLVLALAVLAPATVMAGPASDAVKFFYTQGRFVGDPDYRDRFVGPVKKLFDQNDAALASADGIPCIDSDPALDAQDFDDSELARTLKLAEAVHGDQAEVTAIFSLFPGDGDASREMLWSLTTVDGEWKVADISSKTNGWKLSELECFAGNAE